MKDSTSEGSHSWDKGSLFSCSGKGTYSKDAAQPAQTQTAKKK